MQVLPNSIRSKEYILSLQPNSTFATLPSPSDLSIRRPVAWSQTHADLSLGIHVQPEHRRKGLAKRVIQHRLSQRGDFPGFVYVETTNEASEALWVSLGWHKMWEAAWARFQG